MASAQELAGWIELHRTKGDGGIRALLLESNRPAEAFATNGAKVSATSRRLADKLSQGGVYVITLRDNRYPQRLLETLGDSAPPVLYIRGNSDLLCGPALAVIGTRRPSKFGRAAAAFYVAAFTSHNWVIVSGNAPGIDATAHQQALQSGGCTIVFPPVPLDQFVPSYTKPANVDALLVLSPFVPGSDVVPFNFLRRNSLVAAHSSGALVAETGTRGGTLDTVRKLRTMRRPMWVSELPTEAAHENSHRMLISSGALPAPLEPSQSRISAMIRKMETAGRKRPTSTTEQLAFEEIS